MRGVDARRAFLQYDCIFIEIALFSDFTVLYCEARRLTVPVKRHRGEPGHERDKHCLFFPSHFNETRQIAIARDPSPVSPPFPTPALC